MLLIICDHTFPLLGDIVKTFCLGNRMENYIIHILKHNRSHLIAIIGHKKMPRGERTFGGGCKTFDSKSIEALIPPMQHLVIGLSCLGL